MSGDFFSLFRPFDGFLMNRKPLALNLSEKPISKIYYSDLLTVLKEESRKSVNESF